MHIINLPGVTDTDSRNWVPMGVARPRTDALLSCGAGALALLLVLALVRPRRFPPARAAAPLPAVAAVSS